MIRKIQIANYKSIDKLEFELGRVNVLIGENGAGKSNILEAIALAGAAAANKLDNEFLSSRGIRVTRPEYMRPAFPGFNSITPIELIIEAEKSQLSIKLTNDNSPYSKWLTKTRIKAIIEDVQREITDRISDGDSHDDLKIRLRTLHKELENLCLENQVHKRNAYITLEPFSTLNDDWLIRNILLETCFSLCSQNFIIFSPENSALRTFQREGQIEPLGINGEGLLKLLSVLSRPEYSEVLEEIKASLQVLGWFEDLRLTDSDPFAGSRIEIKDRYLDKNRRYFDQLSTNEGFLFLLFYFALFSTDLTPKFFAIDNIDASLNPKLCEKLMRELVKLAEKHDKQVILTTHNPAILDGLNLEDDEQRLFVVSRNKNGATRMKRVSKPTTSAGERPIRLSELFLRGVLGGLPKGF
jgi:predicted ATPase